MSDVIAPSIIVFMLVQPLLVLTWICEMNLLEQPFNYLLPALVGNCVIFFPIGFGNFPSKLQLDVFTRVELSIYLHERVANVHFIKTLQQSFDIETSAYEILDTLAWKFVLESSVCLLVLALGKTNHASETSSRNWLHS